MTTTGTFISAIILSCATIAGGQALLTKDPLTNLAVSPATDPPSHFGSGPYNAPTKMPPGHVCKSQMEGNMYEVFKIKVDAMVTWLASSLPGFKKVSGYESGRSQTAFYNADGTLVVIVTGNPGAQGENTAVYGVAYERYQPGLSEKTIASLTQGKIICQ